MLIRATMAMVMPVVTVIRDAGDEDRDLICVGTIKIILIVAGGAVIVTARTLVPGGHAAGWVLLRVATVKQGRMMTIMVVMVVIIMIVRRGMYVRMSL